MIDVQGLRNVHFSKNQARCGGERLDTDTNRVQSQPPADATQRSARRGRGSLASADEQTLEFHTLFINYTHDNTTHLFLLELQRLSQISLLWSEVETLVLPSGYAISRHLSELENKAQLESYFHLKRVPTILTIERGEKEEEEKKAVAGGGTFSSAAGGSPDVELGQFLGQVRPRPARPQRFSQCRQEQELADKVHCVRAARGRFQRGARSVVPPGLARSVTDALEHPRRRQREENLPDQNAIFPPRSIHRTRCAERSVNAFGRGWVGRPTWSPILFPPSNLPPRCLKTQTEALLT